MKKEANIAVAVLLFIVSIALVPVLPANKPCLPQNKVLIRYK